MTFYTLLKKIIRESKIPKFLYEIIFFLYNLKKKRLKNLDIENSFKEIYKKNMWNSKESFSGQGSNKSQTRNILREILKILKKYKIKKILDLPCGDCNWISPELLKINYVGGDIVEELIENNKKRYKNFNSVIFKKIDSTKDKLEKFDLILCRDLFQHLSYESAFKTIKNIKKSKSKYFLATSFKSNKDYLNRDISDGLSYECELFKEPFNFPKPIKLIEEDQKPNLLHKQYLSLWKVKDIPNIREF